ncbi:MAG: DUF3857 domain-containing protein [Flavobacteriales bacterium]|nr:DUF3857 domain-containing protein [Flavobacteriales bacterium]
MLKKINLLLLSLLLATFAQASKSFLLNYEWKSKPAMHELTENEKKESTVYILHKAVCEILYQSDGSAIEYYMEHVVMHLNDADAVDENNKVFLSLRFEDADKYTIVEKARVIKANGKVKNLDASDILEEEDEETGVKTRYFALEGIEVGDEIEYYYIYPRNPRLNGVVQRIQSSNFKREATIIIISPSNLEMSFKSLNGFPEMTQNEDYDENFYSATDTNVVGLKEEKYASYQSNRKGVIHYLHKNTYNHTTIDWYSKFPEIVNSLIVGTDYKKSGLKKLVKTMMIDQTKSEEDQILQVENYIKREFRYIEIGNSVLSDVKQVMKNKLVNQTGLLKMYAVIFDQLGIEYEVVYTTNRRELEFDADFECYAYLNELLFYFPASKKYMSPVGINNRVGFPPAIYTANYGLFTKFSKLGGQRVATGKVKYIDPVDGRNTSDEMTITLSMKNLPETKAHIVRSFTGYNALDMQCIYEYMDDDEQKEMREAYIKTIDEDMNLDDVTIQNCTVADIGKELTVEADFTSEVFIQKAGENYLINVGKLIGPQAELYQENDRQLPVSNVHNHQYVRHLVVEIPEGYEVANLDDLAMNIRYEKDDGHKDMGFVSTYKLEGSKLLIEINEYYYSINYTVEEYPKFEKVINAAADFNKVAVLLKKK